MGHVRGPHQLIELLAGKVAKPQGDFAQTQPFDVSIVGDFGGFVVADLGADRGDQHQRVLHILIDALAIQGNSANHVVDEPARGVVQQRDRMQEVVDQHRLENVQLEISLGAGEGDGGVVSVDLHGDHGHGFALRGIHFAGHDRRAGLVFGDADLGEAAARSGSEPANVVGDFHQRNRERGDGAVGVDEFVVRGKRGKFIAMRAKRQVGELRDLLGGALGEFGMRVQAGADGGAADGQIVNAVERLLEAQRHRAR